MQGLIISFLIGVVLGGLAENINRYLKNRVKRKREEVRRRIERRAYWSENTLRKHEKII